MDGAPGVTDLVASPLFGTAAVVLLLIVPLLTMRLFAEERRNRTLPLLMSAPVSMSEIVLGKYLGLLAFLAVMLALIALMPLSLLAGGGLDLGKLGAGLLGLALLTAAFAAVGLYMSALTEQPMIAAVAGFGLLLLLWILDWAGQGEQAASALFAYLSLTRHFESLLKGLFDSSDVAYYGLFIASFVILTIRRLDALRLQH
jgi:ABC-2 type transport system permease protein